MDPGPKSTTALPAKQSLPAAPDSTTVKHSIRTAVAAALSLATARVFGMHEAYWAPITTLIVMQSTLGASINISLARMAGTTLGSLAGALAATYLNGSVACFGICILIIGLLSHVLRLQRIAYRYAGITFAVIFLIARTQSPWVTAAHRFAEVSIGIAVGLLMTLIWPEIGRGLLWRIKSRE